MGKHRKLKRYLTVFSISSHEVESIVDVLARARQHLSFERPSLAAELIQHAMDKLDSLCDKEASNGNHSETTGED